MPTENVLTDQQIFTLAGLHVGKPAPLHKADLSFPFIYDRKWGVFHCAFGVHQLAMAYLLAFHQKMESAYDDPLSLDMNGFPYNMADRYLETVPGTCFYSTISRNYQNYTKPTLTTFQKSSLNAIERRIFAAFEIKEVIHSS